MPCKLHDLQFFKFIWSKMRTPIVGNFLCCWEELFVSGFHQVALRLDLNGLQLQGLKEYSDDYLALDNLRPILGSKCLVMQAMGNYLGLGPSEETLKRIFQVATRTFNLSYYFPFKYTHVMTLIPNEYRQSSKSSVLVFKFKVLRRLRMPIARYCLSVELVRVRSSLDS
jgi:hypothetical protein